jgi:pyruvate/2-oxoglutarate dehydrogenase complex dihydrolipoamide dehydrogenase (E3) component
VSVEHHANVIVGSGEGGKYLAWHLAQSGQQAVVVERRWVGGSCPNVNCLPSKNEIWSAKVADLVHHATRFGVTPGSASSDMAAVRKRKREMVEGLIAMHLERYKATGAELVMGEAKFTDSKTLDVKLNDGGTRTLTGERIFLNLGTRGSIPSVPGLAESEPLTNIEVLELDRLPEHLIVLGGGYVGAEFAQAYRRFGSRVTILERGPQLLAHADPDIAAAILQIFSQSDYSLIGNHCVERCFRRLRVPCRPVVIHDQP